MNDLVKSLEYQYCVLCLNSPGVAASEGLMVWGNCGMICVVIIEDFYVLFRDYWERDIVSQILRQGILRWYFKRSTIFYHVPLCSDLFDKVLSSPNIEFSEFLSFFF